MTEIIMNTALGTVCSLVALVAMARALRRTGGEPAPIKIRVEEDNDR